MTLEALATFAQVIPVLFIAAFLGGIRIGRSVIDRGFALGYILIGAVAEIAALIFLGLGIRPGTLASAAIITAAICMIAAVVATTWVKLQQDDDKRHHDQSK